LPGDAASGSSSPTDDDDITGFWLAELQETDFATVAEATTANYLRMLGGRVSAEELGIPGAP